MQLTAELKPVEELKLLPKYELSHENGDLKFGIDRITNIMMGKGVIELKWSKEYKSFMNDNYIYNLEWLTNITISDDRLKLGLEIEGNKLTVKILEMHESLELDINRGYMKKFENKFYVMIAINITRLGVGGILLSRKEPTDSYTFKSQKQLQKWIRNLMRCE